MSRIPGRVLWTVGTLAIVVAMAQVAEAQREGGRRGGRGFGGRGGFGAISAVQLAADSEEVQTALNLNEDQMAKVEEINDQLRDDRRELFQGGGGDFRAMREDMEKLNTEANAKLAEVLDDNQKKRLMGIQIQVNGANMLLDAAVAKELSITEDQTAQLEEARDDNMRAMRDAFEDIQDLSREERRAKQQELRTEADNKLLAVLTDDQKSKFEALKGEAVEVDMSQFRGGFGGRGGGGGGRNRDRDRDRDDDSDQGV
jgi:Spy/CpxP family protein refolding chaperone